MGSSYCDRSCTLRPPGRYATEGTTGGRLPRTPIVTGAGRVAQFHPFIPSHVRPQNLVLPDTFFSFYDLRREFHVEHPSTHLARDLTVATMAQGTCDPVGSGWRGGSRLCLCVCTLVGYMNAHSWSHLLLKCLKHVSLGPCWGAFGAWHMSACVWAGGPVRAYMSRAKTNMFVGTPRVSTYIRDLGLGGTSQGAHAGRPRASHPGI